MKFKINLLLFLLFITKLVISQNQPLRITTTLSPPYPRTVNESIKFLRSGSLIISNTSLTENFTITLGLDFSSSNGVDLIIPPKVLGLPINISAGETKIIEASELERIFSNLTADDIKYSGIDVEDLVNNPNLPEGIYTFCITAYDNNTLEPLSPEKITGCSQPIWVRSVDPPQIIIPFDESQITIDQLGNQNFMITWTPPNLNDPDLLYEIDIREMDSLINPFDAFETRNYYFYQEKSIMNSTFFYGPDKPALKIGKKYVIRVRAYFDDNRYKITNNGWSDLRTIYTISPLQDFDVKKDDNPKDDDEGDDDEGDDSEDTIENREPLPRNFACGSSVLYDTNGINKTPINNLKIGDTIYLGNYFLVLTNQSIISKNNGTVTGKGVIMASNYLPIGIAVTLNNLKVNVNKRVYDGEAVSISRTNSWIDRTWNDFSNNTKKLSFGNNVTEIINNLNDPQFYINNLKNNVGTTLPIGYGQGSYKLHIVGVHFLPNKAEINLIAGIKAFFNNAYGKEQSLLFGAGPIPIHPGGLELSNQDAYLHLLKTVSIEALDDTKIFLQPSTDKNDPSKGTYFAFDCDGFKEFGLNGLVKLKSDEIIPLKENGQISKGDTMLFAFQTKTASLDDWIISLDVNQKRSNAPKVKAIETPSFEIAKLPGFQLTLDKIYYDNSPNYNPTDMKAPKGYAAAEKNTWQGIYINQLDLKMPPFISDKNKPKKLATTQVRDLIYDDNGITVNTLSYDFMNKGDGEMGNWTFHIDTFRFNVSANIPTNTRFVGFFKTPLTDSIMPYDASVVYQGSQLQYNFKTTLKNKLISIPAWYAKAEIGENSTLNVQVIDNSEVNLELVLNGKIILDSKIGDLIGNKIDNLEFQALKIRNKKNPKYLEFGNFGIAGNLSTPKIAGFAIGLTSIGLVDLVSQTSFNLGGNFSLTDKVSGSSELSILSKVKESVKNFTYDFDGTRIKKIAIEADLSACKIKGEIEFIKNDPYWGNGFDGSLSATFVKSLTLNANVLFGKTLEKSPKSQPNVRYWYVYGQVLFNTPIAIAPPTPIGIYGFAGGAYGNLKPKMVVPAANLDAKAGKTVSGREFYEISPNKLGLKAGVTLGMMPKPEPFNADLTLEATINTSTWGLSNIKFEGQGYMISEFKDREKAPVKASVIISYDFEKDIMSANVAADVKLPPKPATPTYFGSGTIAFYSSKDKWFYKAGTPSNNIALTGQFKALSLSIGGYFMMGHELEAPIVPVHVRRFLNYTPKMTNNASSIGSGLAFAAGMNVDVQVKEIDLTICNLGLRGTAGFDVLFADYQSCKCGNRSNFGMDNWYANGLGYLYTDAKFTIAKFEVLNCKMGAIAEGGFPNPVGLIGVAKAQLNYFGQTKDVNKEFEVGEVCNMVPNIGPDGQPVAAVSPIEDYKLIESVSLTNGQKNVPITVEPEVKLAVNTNDLLEINFADGKGGTINEKYRFYRYIILQKYTGQYYQNIDYKLDENKNSYTYTFIPGTGTGSFFKKSLLEPSTNYKIIVEVRVQSYINGAWKTMKYTVGDKKGQEIIDKREIIFTTEEKLTVFDASLVEVTQPMNRKRYVYQDDIDKGFIRFRQGGIDGVINQWKQQGYKFYAQFIEYNNPQSIIEKEVSLGSNNSITYDMPTLKNSTIYRLKYIAKKEVTQSPINRGKKLSTPKTVTVKGKTIAVPNTKEYITNTFYEIQFRTSQFNTFQKKLNTFALANHTISSYTRYDNPYYQGRNVPKKSDFYNQIKLRFTGSEPLDILDIEGYSVDAGSKMASISFQTNYNGAPYGSNSNTTYNNWNQLFVTTFKQNGNLNPAQIYGNFNPNAEILVSTNYFTFNNSLSNYLYVDPLLQDAELGLGGNLPSLNKNNTVLELKFNAEQAAKIIFDKMYYRFVTNAYSNFTGIKQTYMYKNPSLLSGDYTFSLKNIAYTNGSSTSNDERATKSYTINIPQVPQQSGQTFPVSNSNNVVVYRRTVFYLF